MSTHDDAPTPRQGTSIRNWPVLTEACRELEEKLRDAAKEATSIAREVHALGETFESWRHGDPGDDLRTQATIKLLDLRERARGLLR